MDLDEAIIFKLLESSDAWKRAKRLGLKPELLKDEAKAAYEFSEKYLNEYGTLPGLEVVASQTGCLGRPVEATMEFVVDELFNRRKFWLMKTGHRKLGETLVDSTPAEAEELIIAMATHLQTLRAQRSSAVSMPSLGEVVWQRYLDMKSGKTGIPFPWPSMTAQTMGMWPKTMTFFVGRPGSGKCVEAGAEVMDSETGLLTPVERIVERRSRIPTFDKSKGIVPVTPLAWIATGRKECLRLTTHAGHELGVTPEHPMLTVDGWKPAGELQPDEYIAAASEMPFAETVVELPDSEVLVLAALLAEGCYSQSFVTFTNDDPEIVRVVDQALMQAVGGRLHHYESQKSWDYRVKSPLDRGTSRVRRLLLEHGMGYKTAPHKTVPDAVFRLGRRQLGLFLGMLWSCDGSVQKNGVLTLGMSSEKLVRQVQHLLLRLGICSTMRSKIARCNGKTFSAWELAVSSTGKARFKELVPMVGQKVERLASLPDHQNPNDDLVPLTDGVRRLLRDAAEQFESVGGDWGEIARSLGWEPGNFGRARLTRRANLSKRVLAAFVEASGAEELRWLLRVRWERIVKVEAVGERDVYDFTVADTHCFVANDLVAHNTFSGVDIALNAWAQGYRVLVISPEMTKEEIAERFFSMYAKVPYAGVVNGGLLMHAEEHLKQTIESVKGMEGFWIVDADDHLDTGDIEQAVEMLKPHLLVLDSVYMLNPGGKGDRHEKIIKVVEWASHFCKRAYDGEGIPILGISQLARPKKKDTSGSISGSAASQNMVEQLRDQLALSDAILWYVHNLFGIVQDDDMRADKQLLYVPLKIRRAVFRKEVRVRWDMDEMDFSEIGVSAEDGYQDDDFDAASKTGL